MILTQTLGLIYDVRAALANVHRSLKPGGVLLCTVPASGRISYEGPALDGDFWRFTEASVRQLFAEVFPVDGLRCACTETFWPAPRSSTVWPRTN